MPWSAPGYPQPKGWKAIAARVRRRDPLCCIAGPRCTRTTTEVDHIVPVHLGGTHDLDNLQGVCRPCHAAKTQAEAAAARAAAPRPQRARAVEPHPGAR
jgi:5-methylcytosine-specific restriction endonuclease McrA